LTYINNDIFFDVLIAYCTVEQVPALPSDLCRECFKCHQITLRDIGFQLGSIEITEQCQSCGYKGVRILRRSQVAKKNRPNLVIRRAKMPDFERTDRFPLADIEAQFEQRLREIQLL
jgi:hypothetical protein